MGFGAGGESEAQKRLEQQQARQQATKKQQQLQLQKKSIQELRARQAGFAGNVPTSLFQSGGQTLG